MDNVHRCGFDAEPGACAVYRTGAVGDTVVAFPVLQVLRERWPNARIDLVAPEAGALAVRSGWADRHLLSDAAWVARWHGGDSDALRRALGVVDALIAYTSDDDGVLRRTAESAGITHVTVWPAQPADDVHVADHLLRGLRPWGIHAEGVVPVINADRAMRAVGRQVAGGAGVAEGEPYAIVHGGASSPERSWPELHALPEAISERTGLPVIVNQGPVEADRGTTARWPERTRSVGPLPLDVLAGLIAGASVYVGNDTGPTHLAAALGIPTVAAFGPASDVRRWAPRGRCVTVLTAEGGRQWPTREEVLTETARMLRVRPPEQYQS